MTHSYIMGNTYSNPFYPFQPKPSHATLFANPELRNLQANRNASPPFASFQLSAADIHLFYLRTQLSFRISDHEYYPNIVMYEMLREREVRKSQQGRNSREEIVLRAQPQRQSHMKESGVGMTGENVGGEQVGREKVVGKVEDVRSSKKRQKGNKKEKGRKESNPQIGSSSVENSIKKEKMKPKSREKKDKVSLRELEHTNQLRLRKSRSLDSDSVPAAQIKDQVPVDIEQYPFDCLGLIYGLKEVDGKLKEITGTGFLVSPTLVLTSASLITDPSNGETLADLRFYPKMAGSLLHSQLTYSPVTAVRFSSRFLEAWRMGELDPADDYALVQLPMPLFRSRYVYLGYDMSGEGQAELYGYDLEMIELTLQAHFRPLASKGRITQVTPSDIIHSIRTRKRQVGAPLMLQFAEGFVFAIGVHSSRTNGMGSACKFTSEKIDRLKFWAQELSEGQEQITAVRMVSVELSKAQQPSHFHSLSFQINEYFLKAEEERRRGITDLLRFYLAKLGELTWKNGEYQRSIAFLQEGLAVCKALFPKDSIESAFFFSNLGLNYEKMKQYDRALSHFETALRINRSKQGEESLGVATAYNNIGNLYKRKGQLVRAQECYNKSLKIKKKLLGEKSEPVAASLTNLALLEWQKKNHAEAIRKYKEGLKIYKQIHGPTHYQISRVLFNMALCHYDTREYDQGIEMHYQSLSMMRELELAQHPSFIKRKQLFLSKIKELIRNRSEEQLLKMAKMVAQLFGQGYDEETLQLIRQQLEARS